MTSKRSLDLVVGLMVAIPAAVLVGVLALASAACFRAQPLFLQERVGRDGRPLRFPKIRTLPLTTPVYADKYALRAMPTRRFGRVLRKSHLDELPQLALVLLGRMSLVGPRPEMPNLTAQCDPAFVALRTKVPPGCTGLWQIGAGANRLIREGAAYDAFYIRHQSVRLDIWILWRTALQIARLAGPVQLHQVPPWTLGHGVDIGPAVPAGLPHASSPERVGGADGRRRRWAVTVRTPPLRVLRSLTSTLPGPIERYWATPDEPNLPSRTAH